MRIALSLAAALWSVPATAQLPVRSESPAALASSQQFIVSSAEAKRDFLIQVAAPVRPPGFGEKIAILYVLDADYSFGLATDIARSLQIMRDVAPLYVVAIGYPGDGHDDWVTGRLTDFIHPVLDLEGGKIGGGGAAFQRFLTEELRPLIERRYPVDPKRSYLAGHSLGGLFIANMIRTAPNSFSGYSIGSPSLWIEPNLLDRLGPNGPAQPPLVFVGVGGEEKEKDMVAWAVKLAEALKARRYPVAHRIFAGEGHVSVAGSLLANALKYLVPAKPPAP